MDKREIGKPATVVIGFKVPGQASPEPLGGASLSSENNYFDGDAPLGEFFRPDPSVYDLRGSSSTPGPSSLGRSPVSSLHASSPSVDPSDSAFIPSTTVPSSSIATAAGPAAAAGGAVTDVTDIPAPLPTLTPATSMGAPEAIAAGQLSKEERRKLKEAELAALQKDKKVLTKQERRAKQEADRAAKAVTPPTTGSKDATSTPAKPSKSPSQSSLDSVKQPDAAAVAAAVKQPFKQKPEAPAKQADLFDHLPPPAKLNDALYEKAANITNIHQAIRLLGLDFAAGTVTGGTARCEGMLKALCHVVKDYTTPPGKMLSRDLTTHISLQIGWLVQCRPLSASMGNAIKHLKLMCAKIDPSVPDEEAKEYVIELIHKYIQTRIVSAAQSIVKTAATGISDDDLVVAIGYSSLVRDTIITARDSGKKFCVCVVDSRPAKESWDLVQQLLKAGISCYSVPYTGARQWVARASKLLLAATAVFNNGSVLVKAGGAGLANIALGKKVDVTVCCESIKAHERNAFDAIAINELSDPDELVEKDGRPELRDLESWRDLGPLFDVYNLKYEVIPTRPGVMVVSEYGRHPAAGLAAVRRMNEHV